MNRNQAARTAQAFQWVAEGRRVEGSLDGGTTWMPWDGSAMLVDHMEFRLAPEPGPRKPLECWITVYTDGRCAPCTWETAERAASVSRGAKAARMREVMPGDLHKLAHFDALLAAAKHVMGLLDDPVKSVSIFGADVLRAAIAKAEAAQ